MISRRDAVVIVCVCITIVIVSTNFFARRNSCAKYGEQSFNEIMESSMTVTHDDVETNVKGNVMKVVDDKSGKLGEIDDHTEGESGNQDVEPKWNWNTLFPTYMKCPHVIFDYIPHRQDFMSKFVKERYKNGIGIEVGAHQGSFSQTMVGSTNLKLVYVNDAWEPIDVYVAQRSGDMEKTKERLERYSNRIEIIKGYSFDVVHQFEDNYFDVIYIDATHTYSSSKLDFMMWWPKLKPGGVLSGHDMTLRIVERGKQRVDALGNHHYVENGEKGEEEEVYIMNVYDAAFEFAYHHGMRAVRMGESFYIYKCTEEDIKKSQEIMKRGNPRPYEQLLEDKKHDYNGII